MRFEEELMPEMTREQVRVRITRLKDRTKNEITRENYWTLALLAKALDDGVRNARGLAFIDGREGARLQVSNCEVYNEFCNHMLVSEKSDWADQKLKTERDQVKIETLKVLSKARNLVVVFYERLLQQRQQVVELCKRLWAAGTQMSNKKTFANNIKTVVLEILENNNWRPQLLASLQRNGRPKETNVTLRIRAYLLTCKDHEPVRGELLGALGLDGDPEMTNMRRAIELLANIEKASKEKDDKQSLVQVMCELIDAPELWPSLRAVTDISSPLLMSKEKNEQKYRFVNCLIRGLSLDFNEQTAGSPNVTGTKYTIIKNIWILRDKQDKQDILVKRFCAIRYSDLGFFLGRDQLLYLKSAFFGVHHGDFFDCLKMDPDSRSKQETKVNPTKMVRMKRLAKAHPHLFLYSYESLKGKKSFTQEQQKQAVDLINIAQIYKCQSEQQDSEEQRDER